MSLPLPKLDDRRWADLVEQGRALVPLYSPEWTDHNATDPGITLMELLAWVAEGDIYQLNRITARQKRRGLSLLGIRPEPPRPATFVCELRISGAPALLPASLEFSGQALDGQAVRFKSSRAVNVNPLDLRAVQRRDSNGYQNLTAVWAREDVLAAFDDDPSPGSEFYLGFEQPLPAAWTTLYFVVSGDLAAPVERRRILDEASATSTFLPHHDVRLAWEYFSEAGGAASWIPLEAEDDTRALTLSGGIRVRPGAAHKAQAIGQVPRPLYYIRSRVVSGAFDQAPRLERIFVNGVELMQSTPVTQTWSVAAGAIVWGTPTAGQTVGLYFEMNAGAITKLTVDAAPGDARPQFLILGYVAPTPTKAGTLTVQAALVGTASGEPEQSITIGPRPIVESSFRVFSLEGSAWRTWTRVDDFAASSRAAAHFLLDPTSGDVTFGDGERGRTAPAGSLLVVQYEATFAGAAIDRVTSIADSPLNHVLLTDFSVASRVAVSNQFGLEGGSDAETLPHAIGRGIESREASLRAVTVEDFVTLTQETPGTRIARVAVRPNLYPGLDCVTAPGIVTVVVVPSLPADRPFPSAGLVRLVANRLERRRTIGTRVVVAGPSYLEVAIRASVKAFDGADRARLNRDVSDALDAFFHPLRGGPDGTGWPLGRDVFRAEVMQVIDETPGVDHVLSLELVVEGCEATCGNVCLRPQWLVASGAHQIEVL
jgi:hypothetical protein